MSPLRIQVLDRALNLRGEVGDPLSFACTDRHNAASSLDFQVANDHPRFGDLLAEGAVVRVLYDGMSRPLISGPVTKVAGTRADRASTFTVLDVWASAMGWLGWATDLNRSDDRSGPAETIAKGVIGTAAARLKLPVIVAPDQGRGAVLTGSWRYQPITDVLLPILQAGGIGLSVQVAEPVPLPGGGRRSPGFVVDCYTPRTYPRALSDVGGQITDWTFERTPPTGTRWVLGGAGENEQRLIFTDVNTADENLWGSALVAEKFIDSSQVGSELLKALDDQAKAQADLPVAQAAYLANPSQSTQDAYNDAQARVNAAPGLIAAASTKRDSDVAAEFAKARAADASKSGLSVTLAQTSTVRYGDAGLRVGDLVPMRFADQTLTSVLSECSVSWTQQDGLLVTPVVGQVTNPFRQVWSSIAALRRDKRVA